MVEPSHGDKFVINGFGLTLVTSLGFLGLGFVGGIEDIDWMKSLGYAGAGVSGVMALAFGLNYFFVMIDLIRHDRYIREQYAKRRS